MAMGYGRSEIISNLKKVSVLKAYLSDCTACQKIMMA
jgi:hypothetical protein